MKHRGTAKVCKIRTNCYALIFLSLCALLWLCAVSRIITWNSNPYSQVKEAFTQLQKCKVSGNTSSTPEEPEILSIKLLPQPTLASNFSTSRLDEKTILIWYVPFGVMRMPLHFVTTDRDKIDVRQDWEKTGYEIDTPQCGKCRVTSDRNEAQKSSAIVFHARDIKLGDLPSSSQRKNSQLYVWWSQECSINSGTGGIPGLLDYFNVSMFYRRSSDIYSPYLTFRILLYQIWKKQNGVDLIELYNQQWKRTSAIVEDVEDMIPKLPHHSLATKFNEVPSHISNENAALIKKKERKVAWIASNCHGTPGASLRYNCYEKLVAASLVIDVYGECGPYQYPVQFSTDPGFYEILSGYKFYLSMENSFHCRDYITEKLWFNSMYSGVVPIVFGPHKDDIAAIFPPKSYIHVEDFSSYTKLVNYIDYLDKNASAYAEYLEWRDLVKFFNSNVFSTNDTSAKKTREKEILLWNKYANPITCGICALCKKLHEKNLSNQLVHSVDEMLQNERKECLKADLAKTISDQINP